MTNMRNEIAKILKTQLMLSTHDERDIPDAADAIIELVQARIDEQVGWVRDLATDLNLELATDLNNAEARIDELEEVLKSVADYVSDAADGKLWASNHGWAMKRVDPKMAAEDQARIRAALKGTDA